MARIRTIKPELWQDEQLGALPSDTLLLFVGLISHADDEGRLRGNPLLIRAQVFPYRPNVDVEANLVLLAKAGRIQRYVVEGQSYIWVCKFKEHQRIERPKASALPVPPPLHDGSMIDHGSITDRSPQEGKGMEGNGSEGTGAELPPPPKSHGLPDIRPPDTAPEAWTGDDFWRWAQVKRQEAGLAPERQRPRDLGRWYSAALLSLNGNVGALQEAFYRFGDDTHWQSRAPPLPFAGFVSQWDRFLPPGVIRAAS